MIKFFFFFFIFQHSPYPNNPWFQGVGISEGLLYINFFLLESLVAQESEGVFQTREQEQIQEVREPQQPEIGTLYKHNKQQQYTHELYKP